MKKFAKFLEMSGYIKKPDSNVEEEPPCHNHHDDGIQQQRRSQGHQKDSVAPTSANKDCNTNRASGSNVARKSRDQGMLKPANLDFNGSNSETTIYRDAVPIDYETEFINNEPQFVMFDNDNDTIMNEETIEEPCQNNMSKKLAKRGSSSSEDHNTSNEIIEEQIVRRDMSVSRTPNRNEQILYQRYLDCRMKEQRHEVSHNSSQPRNHT